MRGESQATPNRRGGPSGFFQEGMSVTERKSPFKSFWYTLIMSIVSAVMLAEYTRLVLTTDDSPRRLVVLFVWLVIAAFWITMFARRLNERRRSA